MWKLFNDFAYRVYFWYRNRGLRNRAIEWPVPVLPRMSAEPRPVLYAAWGRIGDLVLATGHLKRLRQWFHPHPIWFLGRSQVRPVVEPYVDVFFPFPDPAGQEGGTGIGPAPLERILNQSFRYVIADIHTFYGGLFALGSLLTALRADRKFIYEGYYLGGGLAPERPYPADFEIVAKHRAREESGAETNGRHILDHNGYYIRDVLERCGVGADPGERWRPDLGFIGSGTEECRRFGLEPGKFVGWQPSSNNPRKDYPLSLWKKIISAFPDQLFVALVEPGTGVELDRMNLPNIRILDLETTLPEAVLLIREARLFVGLDSGLSHVSTVLGRPTVCVCPDSHLGYFFPYPDAYGYPNQHTVSHPDYLQCRGCFMTCRHEPLTSTFSRGALCLRTLPPRLVIDAIKGAL